MRAVAIHGISEASFNPLQDTKLINLFNNIFLTA